MTALDWFWIGILTGLAAAYVAVCLGRRARRRPVQWEVKNGILRCDQRLTEAEVEEIKARWRERYGKPVTCNHEPTAEEPS